MQIDFNDLVSDAWERVRKPAAFPDLKIFDYDGLIARRRFLLEGSKVNDQLTGYVGVRRLQGEEKKRLAMGFIWPESLVGSNSDLTIDDFIPFLQGLADEFESKATEFAEGGALPEPVAVEMPDVCKVEVRITHPGGEKLTSIKLTSRKSVDEIKVVVLSLQ